MIWLLLSAASLKAAEPGYVADRSCRGCHTAIYDGFQKTGMGRSFYRIDDAPLVEQWGRGFLHATSGRRFAPLQRGERFFLLRTLPDGSGPVEKQIHFVIGSGNHSRTYLHRKPNGKLVELPLSWYSDNGGHWAMSPGYDRPDHSDMRREVTDSCLFCHNGYPPAAGGLAEGIGCQRCHGPGANHLQGGGIVNPAKLDAVRREEVCLQCHLESASRSIPDSIRRYNRGPYTYRPGEPLSAFILYFDRALPDPEHGFTVNHSAYGFRQSRCFQASRDRLGCTTCHDPHRPHDAPEAAARYVQACRACHPTVHPERTGGCATCHMPKRRTDDAIHVVMTDHRIQRSAPANLLSPKAEKHGRYDGPVKPYYPESLGAPLDRLYLAVAGLAHRAKERDAIANLKKAIGSTRPAEAEFYFEMAQAERRAGVGDNGMESYREALRRNPAHAGSALALADLLLSRGRIPEASSLLEETLKRMPDDTALINGLAVCYSSQGFYQRGEKLLRRAIELDADLPLSWFNLGVALEAQRHHEAAAAAYREALRLQPDFDRAKAYLKKIRER